MSFMKPTFKNHITAAIAGLLGLGALVLPAAAETIYFDDFNDQQNLNAGGSYTQTLANSVPTVRSGTLGGSASATWTGSAEAGGWGQRDYGDSNVATPTSSNYLAFTPQAGYIYTLEADITVNTSLSANWFAIGFTATPGNWGPLAGAFNLVDYDSLIQEGIVRWQSPNVGVTRHVKYVLDTTAPGWTNTQNIAYVGWFTAGAGGVNLNSLNQVSIDNFKLTAGVANPTVTYDGNGSDNAAPTDVSSPYTYGATVTVLGAGTMTRTGFTFTGWNTAANGSGTDYSPAATFTIYNNTTLYAKWVPAGSYTLTYSGNGNTSGSAPVDANSPYFGGSNVTVLGNTGTLSRTSFTFSGWNTAADGNGVTYNPAASFTINANTTLYARWIPGPDFIWNNAAATGNWSTTTSETNWSGAAWVNSATNNAFFSSIGGSVFLEPGIIAGAVNVGNTAFNFGNLNLIDGDLSAASLTVQGRDNNGDTYGANPTLNLNSTVSISGDAAVGRANLNISGGTFTANRIISAPASADWGRLVVSGGIATANNGVDGSANTSATFAIDLNGGELRTPSVKVANRELGVNGNAWLTFNGGTLTAIGADNANFITTYGGGQNTFVASGGAIIDTNGRNIGIQVNLLNGGGGGGLTKQGAGTLTISGAYGYTGSTVVEGGTLSLSTANLSDAATVDIGPTAVLNLPNGSTDTVSDFLIDGVSQGPGTWNAANTGGRITGGSLLVISPDPFLAWIDQTWPSLSDKTPNGDPDNDGIPNLVEYVLQGGDPSQSTTGILPAVDATGANFIFTCYRRTAATGTTQTFEYGTDLGTWTPVAIPGGAGVAVADQGGGIEKVEITVSKGANAKLFGRLQVTQP